METNDMKTNKPQQKFNARFEIQGEILAYKRKAENKIKKAIELEVKIKALLDQANAPETPGHMFEYLRDQAQGLREKADRARRAHLLIEEEKIPQLTRTLAAFDTRNLAFDTDKSVVLQK
jgi:hypothetical protein